jgi:hypothetical protein
MIRISISARRDPRPASHCIHQFAVPVATNLPMARECGHDPFVPKVLAPNLELFRGPADSLAQQRQGNSKGMRVRVREPGRPSFPEGLANAVDIRPMLFAQALTLEPSFEVEPNLRCGRQWVVRSNRALSGRDTRSNRQRFARSRRRQGRTKTRMSSGSCGTFRASWNTVRAFRSTCLRESDAIALSLRASGTTLRQDEGVQITAGE